MQASACRTPATASPVRLHHHVDARLFDERARVGAQAGALLRKGGAGSPREEIALVPAGRSQVTARTVGVEIANGGDVQAGGVAGLGQEHGRELARADQPDSNRRTLLSPRAARASSWLATVHDYRSRASYHGRCVNGEAR